MDAPKHTAIEEARDRISESDAIIITAGAGMGVDSGLPDFRGDSGFWKAYPMISKLGISFSDMANPRWFETNPRLAWAFYGHRYNLYRDTHPHDGFRLLKQVAEQKPNGYFVFTSNVDGQFQAAGFKEDKIEEVHGSIRRLQCTRPCSSAIWEAEDLQIDIDEERFEAGDPLPKCPNCGALARPNILMFGDWTWLSERSDEQRHRFIHYLNDLKSKKAKPVIIEIGAGKAVSTVRMQSERLAREFDASLIRINPRDYQIPGSIKGIEISAGALEGIFGIMDN
jgi:NAD-dependent SIR2 family protein deacetylase